MRTFIICLALLSLLDTPAAQGQLFGHLRSVGRPLAGQAQSGLEDVGVLSGSERFLRDNRGRAAFVGADQTEGQSFVGNQQARTSGTIVSSTAGIEPPQDQSRQINLPLTKAAAGQMYLPKITLNIDDISPVGIVANADATATRVRQATSLLSQPGILVSVEGRTAILSGVVDSDEERKLAETLASFEPGISSVRNLLQTQPAVPSQFRSLPAPR